MKITKKQLNDKSWRINNLYKIRDKNKQLITFKINKAQKHFNDNKHDRNIILKSRQLGFTTFEAIDALDDTLWTPNFKALMLSYDVDSAIEIFDDKISLAWDNYNEKLKGLYKLDTDRSNKLKFDFGNKTYSSIIVKNRGRSGTYNRLHISEFAKICYESPRKAKELLTGTIPAVPYGGRIDIESTAEGEIGYFHDMFWEAWDRGEPSNQIEYKSHFYNWTWDEEEIANIKEPILEMEQAELFKDYQERHKLTDIQITYYYQKWLSLGKDWSTLRQEYPTTPEEAFISSGNKLFDVESVKNLKKYTEEGKRVGKWIYYEDYKPGHRYAMGADVSHGKGKDSSTIVIMDFFYARPKVVAEYANNEIQPDTFAYELKSGGVMYGNCLIAVENNDRGHTTLTTLKGIYYNIYKRENDKAKLDKQTNDLGWNTNGASKPKMMMELSTAIQEDLLDIPSKHIQTELRTYSEDDLTQVRFDEDQTRHWDRTIALALVWQMRAKANKRVNNFSQTNKRILK